MPNHVTHRVDVIGAPDDVESFVALFIITPALGEEGQLGFDFNMIVPMPKILEGTTSPPREGDAHAARAMAETGYSNWYDWSLANWGTKWNAYGYQEVTHEPGHFVFLFDTAWSPPEPVFAALAEHPACAGLTIGIAGFDEGWNFAYVGRIEDGEFVGSAEEATDELYAAVYGHEPERDDDDDDGEDVPDEVTPEEP